MELVLKNLGGRKISRMDKVGDNLLKGGNPIFKGEYRCACIEYFSDACSFLCFPCLWIIHSLALSNTRFLANFETYFQHENHSSKFSSYSTNYFLTIMWREKYERKIRKILAARRLCPDFVIFDLPFLCCWTTGSTLFCNTLKISGGNLCFQVDSHRDDEKEKEERFFPTFRIS